MTYNLSLHHRRSIRLPEYDYSQAGAYFITICTHQREYIFGNIVDGEMKLNELGQIAFEQWQQIPERFGSIELDAFVIMPNHIHGIIVINDPEPVGAGFTPAQIAHNAQSGIGQPHDGQPHDGQPHDGQPHDGQPHDGQPRGLPLPDDETPNIGVGLAPTPTLIPIRVTVGNIVGAYKSLVANECLKIFKTKNETMGKLWQRNYYEHIIRDEKSYLEIAQYIFDNPAKWALDSLFPGDTP